MTLLTTDPGKVTLNLAHGFALYAVVRVFEEDQPGRKVLFQFGHVGSPLRVSMGVDEPKGLALWVNDLQGREHCSGVIPSDKFMNKLVVVCGQVEPDFIHRQSMLLRLSINLNSSVEARAQGEFGRAGPATFALGASLTGDEQAAFEVADIVKYDAVHGDDTKAGIIHMLKNKHHIA